MATRNELQSQFDAMAVAMDWRTDIMLAPAGAILNFRIGAFYLHYTTMFDVRLVTLCQVRNALGDETRLTDAMQYDEMSIFLRGMKCAQDIARNPA